MTPNDINSRIERFRTFFSRREPGDLLFVCNYTPAGFEVPGLETGLDLARFWDNPEGFGRDTVRDCRARFEARLPLGDHSIPWVSVGVGIGVMTALFSGAEVSFQSGTSWAWPVLDRWEDLPSLSLDPKDLWLDRIVAANRAALDLYEDDFCMLPFAFRSPLDLANGIRGDALFTDFYDHAEDVHRLVDRCAEAILLAHRRIVTEAPVPQGRWGMWRTWLPDGILFMNADPVDMISTKFAEFFDRPSSQYVMTGAGGGFYHHHTLGVHQIEYAAGLEGVTVHNLVADSNDLLHGIRDDAQTREAVLAASLVRPIHWKLFDGEPLRDIVDILRHGRFILDLSQADDPALCRDLAERIGKVSNLG